MKKSLSSPVTQGPRDKTYRLLCDIFAAVIFALFALLFFSSARFGLQNADESAYYTFCHRLLFGDAPIVNEWSMTQLSFVFQYLPFRIFYAAAGGTEGCILFLRYFFVALRLLFFAVIYLALRPRRVWALAAATVFTGFLPSGMMTLSYYNIAPAAALLAGLLLFTRIEPNRLRCAAAGFAFACAVICAPLSAAVYAVYSVAVPIAAAAKKKEKTASASAGSLLSVRAWLFFTAGAALCAAIYLAILFLSGGVKPVLAAVPELLRDKTFAAEGSSALERLHPEKLLRLVTLFGVPALILNAVYLVGAPIVKKYLPAYRGLYFAAGCAVFLFTAVSFHLNSVKLTYLGEIIYRPILPCLPGLAALLLLNKKNARLTVFFLFGILNSICMDIPSNITFGGGLVVAGVPAMLLTGELVAELKSTSADKTDRDAKTKRNAKTAIPVICAAALLLTVAGSEAYSAYLTRTRSTLESFNFRETSDALTAEITRGPLKGLRTLPQLQILCENAMDDIDAISGKSDKPFYTADFCPWFYLYADLPYGTYSTSYVEEDSRDRLLRYWEKFPQAVPEYVYIPTFNCDNYHSVGDKTVLEKLDWLASIFEYESTRGKAGYVLRLTARK